MRSVLYLAWSYLAHYRAKSAVLVAAITVVLFLPGGLRALVRESEAQLNARAAATPLLIGTKGSPLELALNSLYFRGDVPETLPHAEVDRIAASGLASPIPLYARFRAQGDPIVGTTLDYFAFRELRIERGRQMIRLGECVLGAQVAKRRQLGPGESIISSPESAFDVAGVYPLRMRISGVLAPSGDADDEAIFVDLRTAWVIEGLAHGHDDLRPKELLGEVDGNRIANASVRQWNEITEDNVGSFHFHGDSEGFPLTAVIALPLNDKAATLLLGRYESPDERNQILRPGAVIDELLGTILTVQGFVVAALSLVGVATLAVAALVFVLSLRLRRREIETMVKIGGSRARVAGVLACEIAGVLVTASLFAAGLTWLTGHYGPELVRRLLP